MVEEAPPFSVPSGVIAQLSFDNLMALVRRRSGHVVRANTYLPLAEDGQIGSYDAMKKVGFRLVITQDKWLANSSASVR